MPILDDVNGPMRPGAGYINMNIAADGTRVSAVRAFLRPALSRPNLTLLLNTNVVKLNFKGTRCVGVKLMTDGAVKDIAADKEVILAAGAINSPKLLMLSGVGEAKALRSLGIDVVENLPGVGENLQDHVLVSGVVFKYKGKMPDRPADSNAVEAEAYLSSGPSGDTDISLVLHQLPVVTPEVASRFGTPPRGRVHNRASSCAAHQHRFRPSGQQQLSGCRRDRWQLSRHGSRFCGHRARHRSRA